MNTFADAFAGFGGPLIGWMIETNHNTALVFAVVAVACSASALIALAVRR